MPLPKRKSARLKGYDYSKAGSYFITICVKDRKPLLSKIYVADSLTELPQNCLTKYGMIAKKYIEQLNDFYGFLNVDKFVIMPNHIHLLLTVYESFGPPRTSVPTGSVVPQFVGTFKRFCNKEYGKNIWQSSFHDHIIRNQSDYLAIWEYIDTNSIKWAEDKFYIK